MPSLDFKGKQYVYAHHLNVPFRALNIVPSKSLSPKPSMDDNLIIHGDNLHALKALMPKYAGKVDCIFIDPPYNTGKEGWCYNDKVNAPLIREWLKKEANPVDEEDLERHDKWLCMMWPRIQLLKELLADDGVIFISIDENEVSHLRTLMDEIFGEKNFIEQIIWNKRIPKNDKGIGNIHEYVLLYVKSADHKHKFVMPKEGLEDVYTFVANLKKKQVPIPKAEQKLKKFYDKKGYDRGITLYNNLDEDYLLWGKINVSWPNAKTGPRYDVLHPVTKNPTKVPGNGWRWKEETFQEHVDYKNCVELHDGSYVCGKIWFAEDESTQPSFKKYLDDVKDLLLRSFISLKSSGGIEFTQIMPEKNFPNPKTYKFIKLLIESISNPNALILDSFAGSGTTAHAVLKANQEDGGNRKFILVEMEDYANEVTAERMRRVIKGVLDAKNDTLEKGLDGSFTFCELGEAFDIDKILTGESFPNYNVLAHYVFYTATGQSLDKEVTPAKNFLIGETDLFEVYLIYKDDLAYLRSNDSALNQEKLDVIATSKSNKQKIVFATAKYMSQTELTANKITFCQIPYAIHKIVGN